MNILIVDDEAAMVAALVPALVAQGWRVRSVGSAADALAAIENEAFEVVLLDLGLPDADGIEIIGKLKQISDEMSIIVLSARHLETEKVRALDEGADDYVNKPFGMDELLARVRAAGRRVSAVGRRLESFVSEQLTVDFQRRRVELMGESLKLSPKEFALLEALCRQAGQVVTHRKMLIAGWSDPNADGQYLRSYIALLRQKVEFDPSEPRLILTEPGVGYRLNVTPSAG